MDLYIGKCKLGNVPLIAGVLTDSDVFGLGPEHVDSADIIELRVDMFDSLASEHVEQVFRIAREKFGKPIIATVRDSKEGGRKEIRDRPAMYRLVMPFADAVDVELLAGDLMMQAKDLCRGNQRLFIGSYHNFESTPSDNFLEQLIATGRQKGADVVKIAVTAKEQDDFIRLMLLTLRHKSQGVITIAMGDKGLPSRVFSPLFGSLITYGSINEPTAPGQLSAVEVMDTFRKLKIR
ncbi:MAG TPA: type I 3-dehydroquinate dehydratase [Dissulfurispiraceae bacterium]|nr:type I 3-dehydroquinate dehydratase [Dissulfurispiraceae bacterium]